ncbi:MAG TPA: nucleotidyl transferase AbiEii/AbiGii toxin family protein [Solirubrobacteraceae bacterium]|nr:nucleotidyl transferase AbiEii/AbiGii toxin family protein [Solirubrobacteraceae bacterium]
MSTKPRRPPGNLSHLQRLANAAAADASMPVGRYQRWINTNVISAVLDRVRDEDGESLFTLKGGAAMELRLGITARASKDYDAAFRDRADAMLDSLDRALAEDWSGFQLRRTEPQIIHETHALRLDIKLAYRGRPWGTVQLEVAPAEGLAGQEIDRVLARPLDPVQIEGPERIACVSVRYQIAQKIHACTEIYADGRENDRFRDLIDLQLLRGLVDNGALAGVREACVEVFDLRDKHAWPPEVTVHSSWPAGFAAMAAEIRFYTEDVDVAAEALREFIAEIDSTA